MREIKFRGQKWNADEEKGAFVYGFLTCSDSIRDSKGTEHVVHEESVSQFTGIKDKNGTEIYEGDMIHVCAGYASFVEFKDGAFMSIYNHPEDGEELLISDLGSDIEVISEQ